MYSAEPLCSSGITRPRRYYGLIRLPAGPMSGYSFPLIVAFASVRISQVPRAYLPYAPSPKTPDSSIPVCGCCTGMDGRLHHHGEVGRYLLGNEAYGFAFATAHTFNSCGFDPSVTLGPHSSLATEQPIRGPGTLHPGGLHRLILAHP